MKNLLLVILIAFLSMGNMQYSKEVVELEEIVLVQDTVFEAKDIVVSDNNYNYYVEALARELKIEYKDLFIIIAYETGGTFDPKIRNKSSGAMGLIQFTNSTAKTIVNSKGVKYNSVEELIKDNPTVKDQLAIPSQDDTIGGPVYQYLKRNAPYANSRELFLTVFYPVAIKWDDSRLLPEYVRKANPGLNRVGDYHKLAKNRIILTNEPSFD